METKEETQTLGDLKAPGEELEPEARAVFEWRQEELRRMGFSRDQAVVAAYSTIDLNEARGLIKGGATPELTFRILEGTDFMGDVMNDARLLSPSDKLKRARRKGHSAPQS